MRRPWLTFLLTIALGVGGVASAWAAGGCPMQQAPASASTAEHECCPEAASAADQQGPNQQAPERRDIGDCVIGMACRPAPAVQASVPPLEFHANGVTLSQPLDAAAAPPSGPLQDLFRPPRTL